MQTVKCINGLNDVSVKPIIEGVPEEAPEEVPEAEGAVGVHCLSFFKKQHLQSTDRR